MGGFDAIVLAGGAAARLNGVDKPGLDVGSRSLLQRAVDAVAGAERTVVVGPRRELDRSVSWQREEPPGGGPVAGLVAGLTGVIEDVVVVLAADLPWIAPAVPQLLRALRADSAVPADAAVPVDAAVLVDTAGHRNHLAAAWRTAALRHVLAGYGDGAGVPVRALFDTVTVAAVADPHGWGRDCDTWDEVHEARRRAGRSST